MNDIAGRFFGGPVKNRQEVFERNKEDCAGDSETDTPKKGPSGVGFQCFFVITAFA